MSYYYGNSGPSFVLYREDGTLYQKYNLPAPHEWSDDSWQIQQKQKRDVNNIMRIGNLKYKYVKTMVWKPTESTGNTYISYLVLISNWLQGGNAEERRIKFYPHSDVEYVYFDVIITKATPFLFSKVPYNGFRMTVESREFLTNISDPNGLVAIDIFGNEFEVAD